MSREQNSHIAQKLLARIGQGADPPQGGIAGDLGLSVVAFGPPVSSMGTILSLVAALELAKRRDVLMTMPLTALSGK